MNRPNFLTFTFLILSSNAQVERRRILTPDDNIGQLIKEQHSAGAAKARFAIHAQTTDGNDIGFDVVEATNPALTPQTVVKANGEEYSIGTNVLHTLLVSDSDSDGGDAFALLAVNPSNDDVHGIVEPKGKKPYRISQRRGENGGKATAEEEADLTPPAWSCGVNHEHGDIFRPVDHAARPHEDYGRRLLDDGNEHHNHDRGHERHNHAHERIDSAITSLTKQLRGVKINPLDKEPRRLQSGTYSYQVDMYIEIDYIFLNRNGGSIETAMNYVNALVTAANVIYEKEISTHLHVAKVALTTLYDNVADSYDALVNIMRPTYGKDPYIWHTEGIDLHHAMLGKGLGGGIAYQGVLCRSDYGFGLTGNMDGNFVSLDYKVVWDLMAFMHEIGHNFNSGHTHDSYSPAIDSCGTTCPSSSTNTKWSTVMSYCHLCSGVNGDSWNNIMYTFGGQYDGSGTQSDISTWSNNAALELNYNAIRYSTDPRREAHTMYLHASSRGTCLDVPAPTTKSPTKQPVTQPPTTTKNCEDPSITTQGECTSYWNCEWKNSRGSKFCTFLPAPPSASPPSPTTPNPTNGGGGCAGAGSDCSSGTVNCCNGCFTNGKNVGKCK